MIAESAESAGKGSLLKKIKSCNRYLVLGGGVALKLTQAHHVRERLGWTP